MDTPTHQTVRLTRGKHTSPHHGVCAMELASMLAGEPFTDEPTSVSRSIAAFLRMYNDMLDDRRRQDLYSYASRVVGTAGSEQTERDRTERLIGWAEEMRARRSCHRLLRRLKGGPAGSEPKDPESAARWAIKAMRKFSEEAHASALALVDELIDLRARSDRGMEPLEIAAPRAGPRVRELTTSRR